MMRRRRTRTSSTEILIISWFYIFITTCNGQIDELQTCIDAFVVHRDKIIRTQDSREMGAKYLTEYDVESRLDCMKWCCETEHCDVFIYEEKKPGTCYLFHCGPPHDFKCKFTSHANYSSAVLTNYNIQSAAALEEQIRRNQQEHELKSLRKSEPTAKEYNYFTNAVVSTTTSSTPTPSTTSTTTELVKIPVCSRNQFECRSSDDCIAIYNVCDGIPQCADGSDEAAELGCPVERTTIPPPPPPPPPIVQHQIQAVPSPKPYVPMLPDVLRYQQMMQQQQQQQHGQYPILYPNGHIPEDGKNWPMVHPNIHQIPPGQEMNYNPHGYNSQQQLPDDSSNPIGPQQQQQPINYMKSQNGYLWNNYQQGRQPGYDINEAGNGNNKLGNSGFADTFDVVHDQRNNLPHAYEQEQARILNHKNPGMRLEEIETANGIYGQEQNRGYAPYYPEMVHQPENSWQQNNNNNNNLPQEQPRIQPPNPTPAPPLHENPQDNQKMQLTTSSTPPPCDSAEKLDDTAKVQKTNDKKPEIDEAQKRVYSTATKIKDNNDNGNHENQPASDHAVEADNHKGHELELRKMADAHLQEHKSMAITDHIRRHSTKIEDLEMSRPKGAVISLALGLSVTAVMAVLIACRLRVVKRRGRGRGHEFAHDADYLVNGMYL